MTDKPTPTPEGNIDSLTNAVRLAVKTVGADIVARELRVSLDDLRLLEAGDPAPLESDKSLTPRLRAWKQTAFIRLVHPEESLPDLPFDHFQEYWANFYAGPPGAAVMGSWGGDRLPSRPTRLLDFTLDFPFGVPACALTPNSDFITYFASRGYDLLTFKTVRDRPWNVHSYPQWAFATVRDKYVSPPTLDQPVVASLGIPPNGSGGVSLVNSFGVPSLPIPEWQQDVRDSLNVLRAGQVMIVSVMGTPEEADSTSDLAAQFVRAACAARDAGAHIVELNFSCPNSFNGGARGLICELSDVAGEVVAAVADELDRTNTPVFIKISYLATASLRALVAACASRIHGVVAINTVSVPVVDSSGAEFFPGRPTAGVSGTAIKTMATATVRELAGMRDDPALGYDYVIIGVGGVTSPQDFDDHIESGADAVQSCSGAWFNPSLAADIRSREFDLFSATELDEALETMRTDMEETLLAREDVPNYLKTRLAGGSGKH
jgi:dihydroorotate dehydrogenase (NAD+) catalytic subunit